MTDISITAANVIAGSNASTELGTAGATITAGQVVYRDSADGKYKLADNDNATAAVRQPRGFALNGASNGQPLVILKGGDLTAGGTLTAGIAYYLSGTPGGICPVGDVTTGDDPVILGIAESASVLAVNIQISGVTL